MSGLIRSAIKSIQRGSIFLPAGTATNTATITAVVMGKTMLNKVAVDRPATAGEPGVYLSSATQIVVTRTDTTGAITVYYEAVEFN